MTLQENIAKFSKIVKANPEKMPVKAVTETARAVLIADVGHIGDECRGKYEHLTLSALADSGVVEFRGVCAGCSHKHGEVSDVMVMRIMCDVCTLLLNGDQPFAMQYSADVAKAMHQRVRTKVADYLEFSDCEEILDSYASSNSISEELKVVFKQTSELLDGLHKVQLVADKEKLVVTQTCVEGVWLPDEYKSSGFKVSTEIPSNLKVADGDRATIVAMYNFACIMDVLVRAITRTRTGQDACSLFVARIDEMRSLSRDLVPVGIKVSMGVHPSVYCPNHFIVNDTIRVMYGRLFTDNVLISVDSVRNTIQIILRYYRARNGGI